MRRHFPEQGQPSTEVFRDMDLARTNDVNWRAGRLGVYTHFGGDDVLEVAKSAVHMFFSENALGPSAFPSLKKFEDDVVGWTLALLNASDSAFGSVTSGGTESIFVACKTARDWARATRRVVGKPMIVAPHSAHPAFNKAAHFLDMEVRRVSLLGDYRVDIDAVSHAIDDRTIMLVGSAPQFPHGVFDPISDLARLAQERETWLHVDACIGGFFGPFARRLGYQIPEFDFKLEGVTSISADLHKYGFTAKGASTVLFHDQSLRRHQLFEFDEWSRGHYVTPTFLGTRAGGPIAAAWAVIRYLGAEGYTRIAAEIMGGVERIKEGLREIEGIEIVGDPPLSVLSYTARDLDVFAIAEAMARRGWFVTRSAEPRAIHMGLLTLSHVPCVDEYLRDLRSSVGEVRAGHVTATNTKVTYGG